MGPVAAVPIKGTGQASYARGDTSTPLIEQTIGEVFREVVARQPRGLALISRHDSVRMTYQELDAESDRLADSFLGLGLKPGDRLAIWANNGVEWLLVQLATCKIGLILVNLNPAYRVHELAHALSLTECRAIVLMRRFRTSDYLSMLAKLFPGHRLGTTANDTEGEGGPRPDLEHIIVIGREPDDDPCVVDFWNLQRSGREDKHRVTQVGATLAATDPINIQFTSGTTGTPKAATLTHRNIVNNGYLVGEAMRLTAWDRICIPVPLFHTFGMVMGNLAGLTHGSTVVYPSAHFDPRAVLEAVAADRCTALYGVPTMFIAELSEPDFDDFDLTSLRTGTMAGAPCPVEVMRQVVSRMHMDEVTISYGMTETSPVSAQSSTSDSLEHRVATVGRVHPHLEIKVVDPDTGRTVERGTAGEYCTRGYSVMKGYWGDPGATADVIDDTGYLHTGDLAVMDDAGYVRIVGRIKDMVIRGGENLFPREIEEFLHTHPAVRDVAVVGVPDPKYGEELCAWIIPSSESDLTPEQLRNYCVGRVAHQKIPKYIRVVDQFPMTASGKVQKFRIREEESLND